MSDLESELEAAKVDFERRWEQASLKVGLRKRRMLLISQKRFGATLVRHRFA